MSDAPNDSPVVASACSLAPAMTPTAISAELPQIRTGWRGAMTRLGRTWFSIDLRALAAFRVALALIVLTDLWWRAQDLAFFYTDSGSLPRSLVVQVQSEPWLWSLHALFGGFAYQALLFVIAGVAAFSLLVGYRTRLAMLVSWVLLASLHTRNPLVLQGGDVLLRCLAFWACFLPLGARWSIDRARALMPIPTADAIATPASAAILLQLALMYVCSGYLKTSPTWDHDGTAIALALQIDQLVTPLGIWLRDWPESCRWLTYVTIWLERLGPMVLLCPWRNQTVRLITALVFIAFHLGLICCFELGPFPYVCMAGWLLFIPATAWDWLARRCCDPAHPRLQMYYDRDCGFCAAMASLLRVLLIYPATAVTPAQNDPELGAELAREQSWIVVTRDGRHHHRFAAVVMAVRHAPVLWFLWPLLALPPLRQLGDRCYRWIAANRQRASRLVPFLRPAPLMLAPTGWRRVASDALVLWLGVHVLMWNLRAFDFDRREPWYPGGQNWILQSVRLDQYWSMFSPMPLLDDGWYLIVGRTADGRSVNLSPGARPDDPISDDKPAQVARMYHGERWRKYLTNLALAENQKWRDPCCRALVNRWNDQHPETRLTSLDMWFFTETTDLVTVTAHAPRKDLAAHVDVAP